MKNLIGCTHKIRKWCYSFARFISLIDRLKNKFGYLPTQLCNDTVMKFSRKCHKINQLVFLRFFSLLVVTVFFCQRYFMIIANIVSAAIKPKYLFIFQVKRVTENTRLRLFQLVGTYKLVTNSITILHAIKTEYNIPKIQAIPRRNRDQYFESQLK